MLTDNKRKIWGHQSRGYGAVRKPAYLKKLNIKYPNKHTEGINILTLIKY